MIPWVICNEGGGLRGGRDPLGTLVGGSIVESQGGTVDKVTTPLRRLV